MGGSTRFGRHEEQRAVLNRYPMLARLHNSDQKCGAIHSDQTNMALAIIMARTAKDRQRSSKGRLEARTTFRLRPSRTRKVRIGSTKAPAPTWDQYRSRTVLTPNREMTTETRRIEEMTR